MAFVSMSDLDSLCSPLDGLGLGNSLQYALAQSAQIKQALESGDIVTAISVAAGTPWTTKPSVEQIEAMVNDPKQGAVILQKLYDSVQGPGYRSPLPNTMPFDQLKQALQKYLAQLTPTTAAPVKAVQDGTINVANTAAIQSFAKLVVPAGSPVPPPIAATPTGGSGSGPAGTTPGGQPPAPPPTYAPVEPPVSPLLLVAGAVGVLGLVGLVVLIQKKKKARAAKKAAEQTQASREAQLQAAIASSV